MKMENGTTYLAATPESVWAALRELTEKQAETDRQLKETDRFLKETKAENDRRMKKYDEIIGETKAENEKLMRETKVENDRRMKKYDEIMGSWANNHGEFAEEYFFNSFENGKQNFFGEKFDRIMKNVKGLDYVIKDEYDIVLVNGKSVGIVEVKFKAHENDIPKVIRKAETFKANHPNYANHQIYLGLATMAFYPVVEQECINQGIAVIKQVGDTVVINDKHLKVF